jgi:chromosome segregation ATPase
MNMEGEMKERFDNLETLIGKTADGHANLDRLIVDVKESLETEMKAGFSALNTKLDDNSIRLDRHAGLLRSGGQRIVRFDDWAEKVDKSLESQDREIAELRERVLRLERKKSA